MKKKDMTVAEPEMVYGWGGVEQGYFMQYVVPKKDVSFVRDLAKVRGWKSVEDDKPRMETSHREPNACTVRAMKDALEGQVHHAKNVEDLFKQAEKKRKASPKKRHKTGLDEALEDIKAGRVHQYDSVDDMFDQIFGKGRKAKTKATAKKALRASAPAKKLSRLEESIQQVERGEVFSADSVDDMFDQILGKGWRTK